MLETNLKVLQWSNPLVGEVQWMKPRVHENLSEPFLTERLSRRRRVRTSSKEIGVQEYFLTF